TNTPAYLLGIGYRNALRDSHAGPCAKAKNDGESDETIANEGIAAVEKKLKGMMDGTLELGESNTRDPLRTTAAFLIDAKMREKGLAAKIPSKTSKDGKVWWKEHIDDLLATDPELVKTEARKRRPVRNEAPVEINVADLFK